MFENILKAWELSTLEQVLHAPALPEELREVERILGKELPLEIKHFYAISNGADLLDSNVYLYPLLGESSISLYTSRLRSWEWKIPEEVVVCGSTGSDDMYGFMNKSMRNKYAPVLLIGEAGEEYGLAGSTFERFLVQTTAYYLLGEKSNVEALRCIECPDKLIGSEPDDDSLRVLIEHYDPVVAKFNEGDVNRKIPFDELLQWINQSP